MREGGKEEEEKDNVKYERGREDEERLRVENNEEM